MHLQDVSFNNACVILFSSPAVVFFSEFSSALRHNNYLCCSSFVAFPTLPVYTSSQQPAMCYAVSSVMDISPDLEQKKKASAFAAAVPGLES